MIKLIAVVGESGSGKDYLARAFAKQRGYHLVVSSTTRPKREKEIEDVDYHFLTREQFSETNFLEQTKFNGWYYGTRLEDIDPKKVNIGVFNPEGVYQLWKMKNKIDLHIFWVRAPAKVRLQRQLDRETNPDVDEIVRRYKCDKWEFDCFKEWVEHVVPIERVDYYDHGQDELN